MSSEVKIDIPYPSLFNPRNYEACNKIISSFSLIAYLTLLSFLLSLFTYTYKEKLLYVKLHLVRKFLGSSFINSFVKFCGGRNVIVSLIKKEGCWRWRKAWLMFSLAYKASLLTAFVEKILL
jgi:hypothetical protein